jgi:hypothetical protein
VPTDRFSADGVGHDPLIGAWNRCSISWARTRPALANPDPLRGVEEPVLVDGQVAVVDVGVRHPTEVALGDEYDERVSGVALVRHREAETSCSARRLAESRQGGISPRCLPSLDAETSMLLSAGGLVTSTVTREPATPERQGDTWDAGDGMKTEQSDRIIERRFDRELLPRSELQVGRMPRDHHHTFPVLAHPSSEGHSLASPMLSRAAHTVQPGQDRPGHSRVHMALRLNEPGNLEDGSRPRCSAGDASASK